MRSIYFSLFALSIALRLSVWREREYRFGKGTPELQLQSHFAGFSARLLRITNTSRPEWFYGEGCNTYPLLGSESYGAALPTVSFSGNQPSGVYRPFINRRLESKSSTNQMPNTVIRPLYKCGRLLGKRGWLWDGIIGSIHFRSRRFIRFFELVMEYRPAG